MEVEEQRKEGEEVSEEHAVVLGLCRVVKVRRREEKVEHKAIHQRVGGCTGLSRVGRAPAGQTNQ